jgi:WD40 repeat protein
VEEFAVSHATLSRVLTVPLLAALGLAPAHAEAPAVALRAEVAVRGYVGTLAWSADGRLLATQADRYKKNPAGPDFEIEASTIQVWDARTGKEVLSLGEVADPHFRLLAFAADGKSLLVLDRPARQRPRELQWWDVATGGKVRHVELDARLGRLALSPDGQTFASPFADGVYLGDVRAGKVRQALRARGGPFHGLAFAPDGRALAAVGLGGGRAVPVWDVASGKVTRELGGANAEGFAGLAFSPDGDTLALAGGGAEVQRWGLRAGKALPAFSGNARRTNHVAFSADGRWLLCAGWGEEKGGEVVVLDARTGERLQSLRPTSAARMAGRQALWAVAFGERGVKVYGPKRAE